MEIIQIDCTGLRCPEPLTLLRNQIRKANEGQIFHLLSDDPVSLRDIPSFCKFMEHTLVSMPDKANPHLFVIKKGLN